MVTNTKFLIICLLSAIASCVWVVTSLGQEGSPSKAASAEILHLRNVFFDSDTFNIKEDGKTILKEVARIVRSNPDIYIKIEGYTDLRGTDNYNLVLAEKRASAVKRHLVGLGVDSKKIIITPLGETDKFAKGKTDEALRLNRRAAIAQTEKAPSQKKAERPKGPEPKPSKRVETSPSVVVKSELTEPEPTKITADGAEAATEIDRALEHVLREVGPGETEFSPPSVMKVGSGEKVYVGVSKSLSEKISSRLKSLRLKEARRVIVGSLINVRLSGVNFDVKQTKSSTPSTGKNGERRWEWDVVPLKSGVQSLLISITFNLDIPGQGIKRKEIPLIERVVDVKPNPLYSVYSFLRAYRGIIVSFALILGGVWFIKSKLFA